MPLPHNYPPFSSAPTPFSSVPASFSSTPDHFSCFDLAPHTLRGSPYHFPCFDLALIHSRTLPFPPCPIHNMQGKRGRHCSFLDCIHEIAHFCGRNTHFLGTQSRSTNIPSLYPNEYQYIINKVCSWSPLWKRSTNNSNP